MNIWIRYALAVPGLPPQGDPREADCILIQAFGRNTWPDKDVYQIWESFDRMGRADQYRLAWLRKVPFEPGRPNQELASLCVALVERYRIPAIVQWEVTAAFDPRWYAEHQELIHCLWPPREPGVYFKTWDVKQESVRLMREFGFYRPIEVAHHDQIVRAALILRKLTGAMPITLPAMPRSYDRNSMQVHTQGRIRFYLMNEIPSRPHHMLFRYVC